jgi:hypothetical protein
MYNGEGTLTLANGHWFRGEFKNNEFIKGFVSITYENGD